MNNQSTAHNRLCKLGLSKDEATIYLALLQGPSSHLELARRTHINRTRVYRVVEDLERRCLIIRRTDDRGTFIIAADPSALEIHQIAQEEETHHRRLVLAKLVPELQQLQRQIQHGFAVHTYEGVEGFKQMIWHELKTQGEMLAFGNMTYERLTGGDRLWSERYRMLSGQKEYQVRNIVNIPGRTAVTAHSAYARSYRSRVVSPEDLPMYVHLVVYNDTVAIFQLQNEQRVGVEIINEMFATTMRRIFDHYWRMGGENWKNP